VDLTLAKTFTTLPSPQSSATPPSPLSHSTARSTGLRAKHPPPPTPPPRSCSLHRPHKAKVGSRGGVAPVGDGFIDLKSKIEGEQEIVVFVLKSLNSGMHVQSLLNCGAQFNTMNKYIPLSDSFLHNQYLCPLRADFTPSLHSMPNYQPRMQIVMANVFQPSKAHNFKSSSLPQLDGIN
jgi:hypothetical protein